MKYQLKPNELVVSVDLAKQPITSYNFVICFDKKHVGYLQKFEFNQSVENYIAEIDLKFAGPLAFICSGECLELEMDSKLLLVYSDQENGSLATTFVYFNNEIVPNIANINIKARVENDFAIISLSLYNKEWYQKLTDVGIDCKLLDII